MIHSGNKNGYGNDSHSKFLTHFNGNVVDSSFGRAKFGQSAGYFNGVNPCYLNMANQADFTYGTGDFTIEMWVCPTNATGTEQYLYDGRAGAEGAYVLFGLFGSGASGGKLGLWVSTGTRISGTTVLQNGTWYHIALVRASSVTRLYLNGVQEGSDWADTTNYLAAGTSRPRIGQAYTTAGMFKGWMDELRISKGLARYTGNFTPPIAPFTADADTHLLLHFDGGENSTAVIDSETTVKSVANTNVIQGGYPITNTGVVLATEIPQKFSGSAYFNGASYLAVDGSSDFAFGTGDFTIDFWVNFNSIGFAVLYDSRPAAEGAYVNLVIQANKTLALWVSSGSLITGTTQLNTFTWYHIALARSGTSTKLFINGVQDGATASDSTNYLNGATNKPIIGARYDGSSGINGYMDEFRVSKGTARWTADFTPPTSAYTADADTKLLLHFDGNLTDSSGTPHTITNVNVVPNIAKDFNGCARFDGVDSYLSIPASSDFDFGAGNFTTEFWIYFNDVTYAGNVFVRYVDGNNYNNIYWSGSTTKYFNYYQNTGGTIQVQAYTGNLGLANNIWYHVMFVRNGTSMLFFLNGVSKALTQSPASIGTLSTINADYHIGGSPLVGTYVKAYIDEYRVSDTARYTANFNPFTAPYSDDANTKLLLHLDGNVTDSEGTPKTVTNNNVRFNINRKFGIGSAYFNGVNAYLTSPANFDFDLSDQPNGNNDFTVDFWFNATAFSNRAIGGIWQGGVSTSRWLIENLSSTSAGFSYRTSNATRGITFTFANTLSTGTWYHFALVRSGDNLNLAINGVFIGSQALNLQADKTFQNAGQRLMIGAYAATPGSFWIGYIDEYRISKGFARWTKNFSVPQREY